ncbi:MAG: hypothetical protein V4607_12965 [Pseudomonadota bacterium]
MKNKKILSGLARAIFVTALLAVGAASTAVAAEKASMRSQLEDPLKAVQDAVQAKKYKEALSKLDEAEAKVSDPSPYESYILRRLRGSAAAGVGDAPTAIKSFNAVLESPLLPPEEKLPLLDALVRLSYSAKQYPQAIDYLQRYRAGGGTSAATLELLPQALYVSQRYAEAEKELNNMIDDLEKAGKSPTEQQLQLLASCALKRNAQADYLAALRRMVTFYPKKSYWLDLILRTGSQPGFSNRLNLDVYRIRKLTGTLDSASDFMEAAQLALQDGFPGEAAGFLKQGYDRGVLGKGAAADVERQNRLKALVERKVAADKATLADGERQAARLANGDGLIVTGLNYVGYGQHEKGIPLMQQGVAKGNLKDPGGALLHLGYAQLVAGRMADAQKTLRNVQATNGSRELAALLVILSRQSAE